METLDRKALLVDLLLKLFLITYAGLWFIAAPSLAFATLNVVAKALASYNLIVFQDF